MQNGNQMTMPFAAKQIVLSYVVDKLGPSSYILSIQCVFERIMKQFLGESAALYNSLSDEEKLAVDPEAFFFNKARLIAFLQSEFDTETGEILKRNGVSPRVRKGDVEDELFQHFVSEYALMRECLRTVNTLVSESKFDEVSSFLEANKALYIQNTTDGIFVKAEIKKDARLDEKLKRKAPVEDIRKKKKRSRL